MNVKDINIKNHIYHLFDDTINIGDFDPNNIKIDEKSYNDILIYCHCICDHKKFKIHKN